MSYNIEIPTALNEGFKTFGFDQEVGGCLYFCDNFDSVGDIELKLHLETAAISFQATAVFFRMELGKYKPQVYLYDYTGRKLEENLLTDIHKKVWSSGNVPIVCIFYDTEVKILDSSQPIQKNNKPVYLETIRLAQKAHHLYNKHFAFKLKTGVFWEEEDNKNKFKFQENSAYDVLILWVREIIKQISASNKELNQEEDIRVIKKVIIQSIMIKYFEERKDEFGKSPFNQKYFQKYNASNEFIDVLSNEKLIDLLEDLENDLNGNLFKWSKEEKNIIKKVNLNPLVQALKAYKRPEEVNNNIFEFIRYYEFNFIPVELISRLYEEFLAGDNDEFFNQKAKKQSEGIYYTPSHLAHLLIDECMPLRDYQKINFEIYKVLDPACGSGIFLVLAFKRLVQWWRLQNDLQRPKVKDLKQLIKCVYGVDKEVQATQLAAFSLCLAMCDELTPKQIIDELQFDDLTKINILYSDFFIDELASKKEDVKNYTLQKSNFEVVKANKFSLVIGNPPFKKAALKGYETYWEEEGVKIPQGQIALKFLSETFKYLEEGGVQCLVMKSSSLLYNSTSIDYKKALFSNYNVLQVLDFTALANNKSIWDTAQVATVAIFTKKEKPKISKNILHAVFRRTLAVKKRLVFEIDDYDLHFINRSEAINNPYIWKINLLGGGRIKSLVVKSQQLNTFKNYIKNKGIKPLKDGYITSRRGGKEAEFVQKYDVLVKGISDEGLKYEKLTPNYFEKDVKFENIPNEEYFQAPNVLIWKNIGKTKLPVFYNNKSFLFNNKIICIKSTNIELLKSLARNFNENSNFYRFLIFTTSAETLINRNTALFQIDYLLLRYIEEQSDFSLSSIDKKVIADVNNYYQLFIRHGEKSKAAQRLKAREKKEILLNFGQEFSKIMNLLYEEGDKQFKLTHVISHFQNSYIAVIFKYSNESNDVKWGKDDTIDINDLSEHEISRSLESKRILRIYRFKDTVILIKPNQYRYWLSSTAYRDADKAIAHYSKIGY